MRLLSLVRFDEVLVLQGAPLLGAIIAMTSSDIAAIGRLAIFVLGSCLLVAHVFLLNDWFGAATDLSDPHRHRNVFVTRGIAPTNIGWLCMATLVASLVLLSPGGGYTVALAVAIAGLSALYSAPPFQLKGVPLASTAVHLLGGMLHFLLGYSVFQPPDARGLEIGAFFAIVFSAGHLMQEVRDAEADTRNGLGTNAATFGTRRSFTLGMCLFTLANVLIVPLVVRQHMPWGFLTLPVFYPVHVYWSSLALREGLTFESMRRLQRRYRWLYAAAGVIVVVSLVLYPPG